MSEFQKPPRRTLPMLVGLGLLVALGVGGWYATRTPTAPPGNVPAVPTKGGKLAPSPDEGVLAPRLSADDLEKIKRGGTLEMQMPGGGSIKVGPPPNKEKSK